MNNDAIEDILAELTFGILQNSDQKLLVVYKQIICIIMPWDNMYVLVRYDYSSHNPFEKQRFDTISDILKCASIITSEKHFTKILSDLQFGKRKKMRYLSKFKMDDTLICKKT